MTAAGSVKPDYINVGKVAAASPLTEQADPRRAAAAVNGDYFDNSSAPQRGAKQLDGLVVKGPNPGHNYAVGMGDSNLGQITSMFLQGTISLPTGSIPLDGLNQSVIPADGVTVFSPLWGDYTRTRVTGGATKVREVVTRGGLVESVATAARAGQLASDQLAVVGRGAGADKLAALKVGDKVGVDYALRNEGANLKMAISGNTMLLKDNVVLPQTDKAIHPRTAIGFDADRSTMFVLTVEGRKAASRGMTYAETGTFLKEVGATTGINLDGGGSATMLAREAGQTDLDVENQPSDGGLRSVPDGVGLFAEAGSGQVRGMRLITTSDEGERRPASRLPRVHPPAHCPRTRQDVRTRPGLTGIQGAGQGDHLGNGTAAGQHSRRRRRHCADQGPQRDPRADRARPTAAAWTSP